MGVRFRFSGRKARPEKSNARGAENFEISFEEYLENLKLTTDDGKKFFWTNCDLPIFFGIIKLDGFGNQKRIEVGK